jgi:hypothetical protein
MCLAAFVVLEQRGCFIKNAPLVLQIPGDMLVFLAIISSFGTPLVSSVLLCRALGYSRGLGFVLLALLDIMLTIFQWLFLMLACS